jgi:hypothetical protein
MAATDAHLQGADRVREVFARVRAGDLSVADLYADDAVIVFGADACVEGRAQIRAFYEQAIGGLRPQPTVEAVLEAPPLYVAIVDVPSADTRRRAVDVFEVDDHGIRRLEIYTHR